MATTSGAGSDSSSLDVVRALTELSSLLVDHHDVDSTLERIALLGERAVPNSDAAGVSLVEDGRTVTTVATRDVVKSVDSEQYRLGEGPCLQAIQENAMYDIRDTKTDQRWPLYCPQAAAAGVRSTLAFPLEVGGEVVGALNLYSFQSDAFDASARETASILAAQAGIALHNARVYAQSRALIGQLKEALESRTVIERARGLVMGQMSVNAEDAMRILRSRSQRLNRKLRDVARDALSGEPPDDETAQNGRSAS